MFSQDPQSKFKGNRLTGFWVIIGHPNKPAEITALYIIYIDNLTEYDSRNTTLIFEIICLIDSSTHTLRQPIYLASTHTLRQPNFTSLSTHTLHQPYFTSLSTHTLPQLNFTSLSTNTLRQPTFTSLSTHTLRQTNFTSS